MKALSSEARDRLRTSLERVRDRIEAALGRAGRPAGAVRLVAVTKSAPPELARALVELGQKDLGENRPEGVAGKRAAMGPAGPAARWHMIGHYQGRKVRPTLALFHLVHSVHSRDLLDRIGNAAAERGSTARVLLQVNVSGESTKQGFGAADLAAALEAAERHAGLSVLGLMTMAPFGATPDDARRVFAGLRRIRDAHAAPRSPLPELSMGMSQDFEAAVAEGATLVRIGSALFDGIASDPGPGLLPARSG